MSNPRHLPRIHSYCRGEARCGVKVRGLEYLTLDSERVTCLRLLDVVEQVEVVLGQVDRGASK